MSIKVKDSSLERKKRLVLVSGKRAPTTSQLVRALQDRIDASTVKQLKSIARNPCFVGKGVEDMGV